MAARMDPEAARLPGEEVTARLLRGWKTVTFLGLVWIFFLLIVVLIWDFLAIGDSHAYGVFADYFVVVGFGVFTLLCGKSWRTAAGSTPVLKLGMSQFMDIMAVYLVTQLYKQKHDTHNHQGLVFVGLFAFFHCLYSHVAFMTWCFPSHYGSNFHRFIDTYHQWKQQSLVPPLVCLEVTSYGSADELKFEERRDSALSHDTVLFNGYVGPVPIQHASLSSRVDKLYSVSPKNTFHIDQATADALGSDLHIIHNTALNTALRTVHEDPQRRDIGGGGGFQYEGPDGTKILFGGGGHIGPPESANRKLRLSRSLKTLSSYVAATEEKQPLRHKLSQYTFGKNSVCSEATLIEPRSMLDSGFHLYEAFIDRCCDDVNFKLDPAFQCFGIPGFELSPWWVLAYTANASLEVFSASITWFLLIETGACSRMFVGAGCVQLCVRVLSFIVASRYPRSLYYTLATNLGWFITMVYVIFSIV